MVTSQKALLSLMYFLLTTTISAAFVITKENHVKHNKASKSIFLGPDHQRRQLFQPFVSSLDAKSRYSSSSRLLATSDESSDDSEEESQFDVEAARKKLESMLLPNDNDDTDNSNITTTDDNNDSSSQSYFLASLLSSKEPENVELPPTPPLSTIERDRKVAEMRLLSGLADGEEAVKDLWALWYSERGGPAKALLEQADDLMGNPQKWDDCEAILMSLVDEHGIYFVEPLNRLATLYFLQSEFEKSYRLCLTILKIKPWHFGALSGIVPVCVGRGDKDAARYWAEKRLPSFVAGTSFPPFAKDGPENPRRQEWVDQQVATAEKLMEKAEKATKRSFGKKDSYHDDNEESGRLLEDEDGGSWQ
mmetsp:Transcript_32803/g.48100  ORF Transcript_32803/g.48100 Transcript_32803/m.48100 type:complete len:363 (+) Transcript_32803:98-1186(+)